MVQTCQRPGCTGHMEDGFCSDCGLAPVGARHVAIAEAASVRTGSVASSPMSARTGGTRSRSQGTRGSSGLGAGFVSLPPLPSLDPLARVLKDPRVPENKRFCGACHDRVTL